MIAEPVGISYLQYEFCKCLSEQSFEDGFRHRYKRGGESWIQCRSKNNETVQ